jgi:hypothetical protein
MEKELDSTIYRWQLGYRFPIAHMADYTTPYTDLPEFDSTRLEAYVIHEKLRDDFKRGGRGIVEWRLVEVVNSSVGMIHAANQR